ncbi:hypothetical protein KIPB_005398 [Kipferlia bialata]|uniref:Guanylate cyclase domain-containing protein n=1 Tax=Kipferlia bialata TaxID=797122 RepID=A0A9K3CVB7_9EUKA|nr:hypothetical protein KIPB_005398 [Kipferlia bialata]|eukprot:g5398.t1
MPYGACDALWRMFLSLFFNALPSRAYTAIITKSGFSSRIYGAVVFVKVNLKDNVEVPIDKYIRQINGIFALLDEVSLAAKGVMKLKATEQCFLATVEETDDVTQQEAVTRAVQFSLVLREATLQLLASCPSAFPCIDSVSVGIAAGSLTAGVTGHQMLRYDVWSDTVNTASRVLYATPKWGIGVTEAVVQVLYAELPAAEQAAADAAMAEASRTLADRGQSLGRGVHARQQKKRLVLPPRRCFVISPPKVVYLKGKGLSPLRYVDCVNIDFGGWVKDFVRDMSSLLVSSGSDLLLLGLSKQYDATNRFSRLLSTSVATLDQTSIATVQRLIAPIKSVEAEGLTAPVPLVHAQSRFLKDPSLARGTLYHKRKGHPYADSRPASSLQNSQPCRDYPTRSLTETDTYPNQAEWMMDTTPSPSQAASAPRGTMSWSDGGFPSLPPSDTYDVEEERALPTAMGLKREWSGDITGHTRCTTEHTDIHTRLLDAVTCWAKRCTDTDRSRLSRGWAYVVHAMLSYAQLVLLWLAPSGAIDQSQYTYLLLTGPVSPLPRYIATGVCAVCALLLFFCALLSGVVSPLVRYGCAGAACAAVFLLSWSLSVYTKSLSLLVEARTDLSREALSTVTRKLFGDLSSSGSLSTGPSGLFATVSRIDTALHTLSVVCVCLSIFGTTDLGVASPSLYLSSAMLLGACVACSILAMPCLYIAVLSPVLVPLLVPSVLSLLPFDDLSPVYVCSTVLCTVCLCAMCTRLCTSVLGAFRSTSLIRSALTSIHTLTRRVVESHVYEHSIESLFAPCQQGTAAGERGEALSLIMQQRGVSTGYTVTPDCIDAGLSLSDECLVPLAIPGMDQLPAVQSVEPLISDMVLDSVSIDREDSGSESDTEPPLPSDGLVDSADLEAQITSLFHMWYRYCVVKKRPRSGAVQSPRAVSGSPSLPAVDRARRNRTTGSVAVMSLSRHYEALYKVQPGLDMQCNSLTLSSVNSSMKREGKAPSAASTRGSRRRERDSALSESSESGAVVVPSHPPRRSITSLLSQAEVSLAGTGLDFYPVCFCTHCDIVSFTKFSSNADSDLVVAIIDRLFDGFDNALTAIPGLCKLKTEGDAYSTFMGFSRSALQRMTTQELVTCAVNVVRFMFAQQRVIAEVSATFRQPMQLRVAAAMAPAFGSVLSTIRVSYDLFGLAPYMARNLEPITPNGCISVCRAMHTMLSFTPRSFVTFGDRTAPAEEEDGIDSQSAVQVMAQRLLNKHYDANNSAEFDHPTLWRRSQRTLVTRTTRIREGTDRMRAATSPVLSNPLLMQGGGRTPQLEGVVVLHCTME